MAIPKTAVVTQTRAVGPEARWLELELAEPLAFSGGQYIIVDSGLVRPNGKAAKRAYSPISTDGEQRRIELVVKRIPGGLSSDHMHRLRAGDEVKLSGPWGKFTAPEAALPELEPSGPRVLVLATDTGITAALGLVQSRRLSPLLASTLLLWLRVDDDFIADELVKEHLPQGLSFRSRSFPPVHHPERLPLARALLSEVLEGGAIHHARVSGDGVINYGLMSDFAAHGVALGRDDVESFFNMPLKSQ
jgi:ferredoxin-NADP reductase